MEFLNVSPFSLVKIYKYFGWTYYPTYYYDDRCIGSSQTSVNVYRATKKHVPAQDRSHQVYLFKHRFYFSGLQLIKLSL
jgi:hypothetical protein